MCQAACVDGFGGSHSHLDGRYPKTNLDGTLYWFQPAVRRLRRLADGDRVIQGYALSQSGDTRWEFFEVSGSGSMLSVAVSDTRQGLSTTGLPYDDYFLTSSGEFDVRFMCCNSESYTWPDRETSRDGTGSLGIEGAGEASNSTLQTVLMLLILVLVALLLTPLAVWAYRAFFQRKPRAFHMMSKRGEAVEEVRPWTPATEATHSGEAAPAADGRPKAVAKAPRSDSGIPSVPDKLGVIENGVPFALPALPGHEELQTQLMLVEQTGQLTSSKSAPEHGRPPRLSYDNKNLPRGVAWASQSGIKFASAPASPARGQEGGSPPRSNSVRLGAGRTMPKATVADVTTHVVVANTGGARIVPAAAEVDISGMDAALGGRAPVDAGHGRYEGPMAEWPSSPQAGAGVAQAGHDTRHLQRLGISEGEEVRLIGFATDGTWNGAEGILEDYDGETGQCVVRFDDGRVKVVSPHNLEPGSGQPRPSQGQPIASQRPVGAGAASTPPPKRVSAEAAFAVRSILESRKAPAPPPLNLPAQPR